MIMRPIDTDGSGFVYVVLGEDGRAYGAYTVRQEASDRVSALEAEYGPSFEIESYRLGDSGL